MEGHGKPLVWLHGEIKTPPFSAECRRSAGYLLPLVQLGTALSMPTSRPMPSIGPGCHESRIRDAAKRVTWRLVYRVDDDAIIIGQVFAKKTQKTPRGILDACRRRYRLYDEQSQ